MRLLVFCHEFPPVGGGASNALYHLGREWARAGHSVRVLTSHYGDLALSENMDGIRVTRIRVGRRWLYRGHTDEMLRFTWAGMKLARRICADEKPDLTVSFMTLPAGLISLDLKKCFGIPFVTELRGADVPGFNPASLFLHHLLTKPVIVSVWRQSRGVIANSRGLAALAQPLLKNKTIEVIANGVDTQIFKPAEKEPGAGFKILFAGRFEETQKNITMLVEALPEIPDAKLILVGNGKDQQQIKALVQKYNLESRVEFRGWLKEADLICSYQEADVFVSASRWEGMPNSVLEAMACGLPLVLSRVSGHEELVEPGRNGFLFEAKDRNTLISSIKKIQSNSSLLLAMGRESRERACHSFEWAKLAERHLEVYNRSL